MLSKGNTEDYALHGLEAHSERNSRLNSQQQNIQETNEIKMAQNVTKYAKQLQNERETQQAVNTENESNTTQRTHDRQQRNYEIRHNNDLKQQLKTIYHHNQFQKEHFDYAAQMIAMSEDETMSTDNMNTDTKQKIIKQTAVGSENEKNSSSIALVQKHVIKQLEYVKELQGK